jgi:hypothetical protein
MKDITNYSENELSLIIQNDEYLYGIWRRTIRTGNLEYIKMEIENIKYNDEQWEAVVDDFESELEQNEKALIERNS